MRGSPDDWLIQGIKGELYLCRDDIFQATYEGVESDPERESDDFTSKNDRSQVTEESMKEEASVFFKKPIQVSAEPH